MGRKPKSSDPHGDLIKRLDLLVAILLAQRGFQRNEVAKILDVSEKTVERMFSGKWNKIQRINDERE